MTRLSDDELRATLSGAGAAAGALIGSLLTVVLLR